jgi:hypothetical protein
MKISKSSLAKCLFSAAMLSGLGVMAQTTAAPTPAKQTAPKQDFATDLAKADLAKQGITDPTSDQLAAAVKNVQDKRASGMGWGQIANSLGLGMGDVVSAANRSGVAGSAGMSGAAGSSNNAGGAGMSGSAGAAGSAGGMGASHGGMGGSAGGKK